MKSVIFDLDGTLADTSGDLIAAANACFVKNGEKALLDPVKDAPTALRGGRAMLTLGFSRIGCRLNEQDLQEYYEGFLKIYADHIDHHTYLYEGVETCLNILRQQNYALGICTNKPEALAKDLIKRLGVAHYFAAIFGADTLPVRKPNAQHLFATIEAVGGTSVQSVLIGDTLTDRETAKNASVPCILVTFGPGESNVADLKPEGLLDHYNDLPEMLKRFL